MGAFIDGIKESFLSSKESSISEILSSSTQDNSINFCREDEDFPMKEYYISDILQSGVIEDTDDIFLGFIFLTRF